MTTTTTDETKKHYQMDRSMRTRIVHIFVYIALIIGALIVLIPFFYMVATSLTDIANIYNYPFEWIPDPIAWWNYPESFEALASIAPGLTFFRIMSNTLFIVIFGMAAELTGVALVSFGFSRFNFPGRDKLFLLLLATMMLPFIITLIPVFLIWTQIGLIDQYDPLIIPAWFGGGAWAIFLLRQFLMGVPKDMEEAATIDGADIFQIFYKIMLPLVRPSLLAIGVLVFIGRWNDFMGPLIYLFTTVKFPLVLAMKFFEESLSNEAPRWNYMMAISTVMAAPLLLIYFFAQRYFIEGLTVGAVKG
jgi:multiple sugar transport system permease protein